MSKKQAKQSIPRPGTKARRAAEKKREAQEYLRAMFEGCGRVGIMCVHWSRSGMQRQYRVILPVGGVGGCFCPTGAVAAACGFRAVNRDGSIRIVLDGCGYSGEDEIASALSSVLGRKISYDAL